VKLSDYLLMFISLVFAGLACFGFFDGCKSKKQVKVLSDSLSRVLEAKKDTVRDTIWEIKNVPVTVVKTKTVVDSVFIGESKPVYERRYMDSIPFDDLTIYTDLKVEGLLKSQAYGYRLNVPRYVDRITEVVRPVPIPKRNQMILYIAPGLSLQKDISLEAGAIWLHKKGLGGIAGYQRFRGQDIIKAGFIIKL